MERIVEPATLAALALAMVIALLAVPTAQATGDSYTPGPLKALSAPPPQSAASGLTISSYRLRRTGITVTGRIAQTYGGFVRVTLAGRYVIRSGASTTTHNFNTFRDVRNVSGAWTTTFPFVGEQRGRVRSGTIVARSKARDFLSAGYAKRKFAVR